MQESFTFEFAHHGEAERWLPVAGYPYYEVSDWGRVRSLPHRTRSGSQPGRILKPYPNGTDHGSGYLAVSLHKDGHRTCRKVHELVLTAFVGPRPDGMQCRHGVGGSFDNRLSNLCWGTAEDNQGPDRVRDGISNRGERCGKAKLTWDNVREIRRRVAAGETNTALAREFGVSQPCVCNIVNGKNWKDDAAA